jgi:hypothetical protein
MRQLENNAKQGGVKGNAAGNELGTSKYMKHRNSFDESNFLSFSANEVSRFH